MIQVFTSPFGNIPLDTNAYSDIEEARLWLQDFFDGKKPSWKPSVKLNGTQFQLHVWNLLEEISFGETMTYGQLAKKISPTMSPKAVGQAVHRNPCPIIIPCHRVVGAHGALTGYALGLDLKAALLNFEAQNRYSKER